MPWPLLKLIQVKYSKIFIVKSKASPAPNVLGLSAALGAIPDDDYPTFVKNGDSVTLKNRCQ